MFLMGIRTLHRWDLSISEAMDTQRRLASQVVSSGDPGEVRTVAGVDVRPGERQARPRPGSRGRPQLPRSGAARAGRGRGGGDLSLRAGASLLSGDAGASGAPVAGAKAGPLDGGRPGFAHPRRFGIACHLGLLLDVPAIGCAKSRLCGEPGETERAAGSQSALRDGGQVIGAVLRTRDGVNPSTSPSGTASGWRRRRSGCCAAAGACACRSRRASPIRRRAGKAKRATAKAKRWRSAGRCPNSLRDSQRRGDEYLCRCSRTS